MCHMRSRKASRVWCARRRGTSTALGGCQRRSHP
jgi:hypothetical protein